MKKPLDLKSSFKLLFETLARISKLVLEIFVKTSICMFGVFLIFYAINVSRLWSRFDFFVFLTGILGALIIIALIFFKKIKTIALKLPKLVKIILIVIFSICFASYIIVNGLILSGMNGKPASGKTDYAIVLGCQVVGSYASVPLIRRVYTAIDYLNKNPDIKVIVTGGQGPGENITEAEAMRRLLTERNIEADRILMENRAANTVHNFKFSDELFNLTNKNIVVVTTDYHMFRALAAAKKLGYQNVSGIASKSQITVLPIYLFREYFAVMYYALTGKI